MPVASMPTTNVSRVIDQCVPYEKLMNVLYEDEFGQWRPICNRFGAGYLAAYHSYLQISPPEEDYDGRLDLYKL